MRYINALLRRQQQVNLAGSVSQPDSVREHIKGLEPSPEPDNSAWYEMVLAEEARFWTLKRFREEAAKFAFDVNAEVDSWKEPRRPQMPPTLQFLTAPFDRLPIAELSVGDGGGDQPPMPPAERGVGSEDDDPKNFIIITCGVTGLAHLFWRYVLPTLEGACLQVHYIDMGPVDRLPN
jgi:hypothetical protein